MTAPRTADERGPRSRARIRRIVGLSGLVLPTVRERALSRLGRFYPWAIAVSHGGLLYAARGSPDVPGPAAILVSALVLMSWAGGLVALAALGDLAGTERARCVAALSASRGITPQEARRARDVATLRVVARSIGLPSSCLALFASRSVREALLLALLAVSYAGVFAAVVGGLACLCRLLAGRRGRVLFLLVLLGPLALPSDLGTAPSVVHGLSRLLHHLAVIGEGAS